jgi:hypothetical protein
VSPLLRGHTRAGDGLFTRLAERDEAARAQATAWRWVCEDCDVADCEHAALRLRL